MNHGQKFFFYAHALTHCLFYPDYVDNTNHPSAFLFHSHFRYPVAVNVYMKRKI